MFKKITILIMTVAIMVTTYFLPASALAEKKEKSSTTEALNKLTVSDLESQFEIIDSTFKGSIRTVTYKKGSELHIVVFNGVTGYVTIDKIKQKDLFFEYDLEKAKAINSVNSSENSYSDGYKFKAAAAKTKVKTNHKPAKPKKGYKYVGTLTGHTKESKNALDLASKLTLAIPNVKFAVKVVIILTGTKASSKIPSAYYTHDLYQKGFMTEKWYQYSTTKLYKDKANKKPMSGKSWTSKPKKIDLPNS